MTIFQKNDADNGPCYIGIQFTRNASPNCLPQFLNLSFDSITLVPLTSFHLCVFLEFIFGESDNGVSIYMEMKVRVDAVVLIMFGFELLVMTWRERKLESPEDTWLLAEVKV
jgi:hypothetical protein